MTNAFHVRAATPDDIPVLVNHRRRMFEDMAVVRGKVEEPSRLDTMDAAYTLHLRAHLADETLRAWVVETRGQVVASGAVSFLDWPPRPDDLAERLALLHSVYTQPEHRRLGLARRIVQAAIDACRAAGLRRLTLHASEMGRPLYESLGFEPTNEMRLVLNK